MIVFELTNREDHPVYQALEVSNGNRQYDFLNSIVGAALAIGRPFLSQHLIKALNFQAITCLHINAGEYRPCHVEVGVHKPPEFYRVPALMDDFVNLVNRNWESDAVVLATYVLWRLNNIHPFINGNGRTARAACYFVLCVRSGGPLQGQTILPELIRQNRQEHIDALQHAHEVFAKTGAPDLGPLHAIITRLIDQQIASANVPANATPAPPPVDGAANNPQNQPTA
jgi:prophage maintenance system killer protein